MARALPQSSSVQLKSSSGILWRAGGEFYTHVHEYLLFIMAAVISHSASLTMTKRGLAHTVVVLRKELA